jgi:solute carrier family 25 aspartate/glutamate transporter 12/13
MFPLQNHIVSFLISWAGLNYLKEEFKLFVTATGYLKRADTDQLRIIFDKYANAEVDGETYMTDEDFIVGYLKLFPEKNYNEDSAKVLCGILDQSKDGFISFNEFAAFEGRLCIPDALYRTAFQLFDTNGNGSVSYDEFVEIISKTSLH